MQKIFLDDILSEIILNPSLQNVAEAKESEGTLPQCKN